MFRDNDRFNAYYKESSQQQMQNPPVQTRPGSASSEQYRAQTPVYGPPTYQNGTFQEASPQYATPQRPHGRRLLTSMLLAPVLVLLIVFGVGLFAGWVFATNGSRTGTQSTGSSAPGSTGNAATLQAQRETAIAKIEPAVVQLHVTVARGGQLGSGVIIDSKGDIITNNHVVDGGRSIKAVLNNGKTEVAQLVGTDPANDLAVVRIQPFAHMAVATIGNSSKLIVGQEVLAVGNPLGITETATNGIVSALNRTVPEQTGGATIKNAIQTDAPINPGNSGGALVTLQGNLVGIPTLAAMDREFHTPASGVGFAIPSNQVKASLTQILQQAGE